MSAASGAAGRYEVIHAARKIAQKDIVLYETRRVFLVYETGGCVSCIINVAVLIRRRILLTAVSTGDIDIAFRRVRSGSRRICAGTVARSSRIQNDRSRGSRIDLAVRARHFCLIVDDKRSPYRLCVRLCRHISVSVAIRINPCHISSGYTDGDTLLILYFRIRHCRNNRKHPCVRIRRVRPFLLLIICQVQCIFNILFI